MTRKSQDGYLEELSEKILDILGEKKAILEVYAVDDKYMESLNKRFRGKYSSTNVLSFPYPKDFPRIGLNKYLGEIYLSPSYIKRHGESLEYMLLHGILHLLGFNHEAKGDRIKMESLEKDVLKKLNL